MKISLTLPTLFFILLCLLMADSIAQELYTARGYWTERNKENYKKIREKKLKGDSLNTNEFLYLQDYEAYLVNYYQRMPEEEKQKYETMKAQWDEELLGPRKSPEPVQSGYEWRAKDRLRNGVYGLYYGISLVTILESSDGAAVGVPLIMAGLWQLGPAINPKKYNSMTSSMVRAGNTGKFLGLGYGLALGLALGGDSENTDKLALGLSTVGSIALGEAAFQSQRKKPVSDGHIELMRHYGFLGPGIGLLALGSTETDSDNAYGAILLAGGVGGLILGNKAGKKYDYTAGDVDVISSQTWIYTGLGFTAVAGLLENNESPGLFLLPAAAAVAGTAFGQRMVKGIYLNGEQGKAISLSSGGAALVGVGVLSLIGSDSPGVWVGVPSVMALITHQLMFQKYKRENLEKKVQLGRNGKYPAHFSMKVMPENYFINNRQNPERVYFTNGAPVLSQPIVKLNFTF